MRVNPATADPHFLCRTAKRVSGRDFQAFRGRKLPVWWINYRPRSRRFGKIEKLPLSATCSGPERSGRRKLFVFQDARSFPSDWSGKCHRAGGTSKLKLPCRPTGGFPGVQVRYHFRNRARSRNWTRTIIPLSGKHDCVGTVTVGQCGYGFSARETGIRPTPNPSVGGELSKVAPYLLIGILKERRPTFRRACRLPGFRSRRHPRPRVGRISVLPFEVPLSPDSVLRLLPGRLSYP